MFKVKIMDVYKYYQLINKSEPKNKPRNKLLLKGNEKYLQA